MLEIVEREPLGTRVCVPYIPMGGFGSPRSVRRIGQHGLFSREAGSRKVGAVSVRRVLPGYSLLFHAVGTTEERMCPPQGCHTRKLAALPVTTACCATVSVGYSAERQGC